MVAGCPVFVLDSRLQSGGSKIPKWDPRAQVGVYLGHSPCHAGSVALVLNPRTLRISPQFHLVFDDEFLTVLFMTEGTVPPHWKALVEKSAGLANDTDIHIAMSWANDYIAQTVTPVVEEDGQAVTANLLNGPSQGVGVGAVASSRGTPQSEEAGTSQSEEVGTCQSKEDGTPQGEEAGVVFDLGALHEGASEEVDQDAVHNSLLFSTMPDLDSLTLHCSKRHSQRTQAAPNSSCGTVRQMFGLFSCLAAAFITGFSVGTACHGHSMEGQSAL